MAIRKRPGRASPYQVYWNNPFTGKRESASFQTLGEARKTDSLIQHRLQHERESFRPEENETPATGGTVREIVALYLAAKQFSGKNLQTTLEHLSHVLEFLGKREVSSLEKKDLIRFMNKETQRGVKTTTTHRRLTILRAALSWAAESELIDANPLLGVKLPHGQHEKIAPPTQAEAAAVLAQAQGHLYRAILLSIFLGVRVGPSELFRLTWKDVDFSREIIRVWSAAQNPRRPYRDVPLRPEFVEEMRAWHEEDLRAGLDTIITYKGKPISSMKRAWRTAKKKAGITRRLRPYDLRHAFATYALDNSADLKAVSDIMGHSNPNMILTHYQHTSEASRRAAVTALPDFARHVPNPCAQEKKELSDEG